MAVIGMAAITSGRCPTARSAPLPAAPPAGTDMVPTFTEDFSGPSLDTTVWNLDLGPRRRGGNSLERRSLWANGEAEVYFDKDFLNLGINPFKVSNGVLTISAHALSPEVKRTVSDELPRHPEIMRFLNEAPRLDYSSGALTTRDTFQQRYGYFEIRASWSAGRGLWPAFWLLPASGAWPPEIDIMEAIGDNPRTAFQTLHATDAPPAGVTSLTDGLQQEFHAYGALWAPSHIDFYVDGRKTGSVPAPAELNQPMYILANLAVGGHWPGYPDANPDFAATMEISYIKAWQFRVCLDERKPCLAK